MCFFANKFTQTSVWKVNGFFIFKWRLFSLQAVALFVKIQATHLNLSSTRLACDESIYQIGLRNMLFIIFHISFDKYQFSICYKLYKRNPVWIPNSVAWNLRGKGARLITIMRKTQMKRVVRWMHRFYICSLSSLSRNLLQCSAQNKTKVTASGNVFQWDLVQKVDTNTAWQFCTFYILV